MNRKTLAQIAIIASIATVTLASAQTPTTAKPLSTPAKQPLKAVNMLPPDLGERKFNANCGRCHSAPQQLSPSIAGTVVRHMRVRASLSAQDEKDILKYLAP